MVNFDDGDREEAEKRWHEGEDAQEGDVDSEGEGGDKWQGARQERDDARGDGNDGRGASERSFTSNLARSRSSTSLKSILKNYFDESLVMHLVELVSVIMNGWMNLMRINMVDKVSLK